MCMSAPQSQTLQRGTRWKFVFLGCRYESNREFGSYKAGVGYQGHT